MEFLIEIDVGWCLTIWIPTKFPGDAEAGGPETTL